MASCVLVLAFELLLICKLWATTRSFTRRPATLEDTVPGNTPV